MRVAVAGHVEIVRFLQVDHRLSGGDILHASSGWTEPGGGGGVAAIELARLSGSCTLYTALGSDAQGQGIPASLAASGVTVVAATRAEPQREAITLIDTDGERTIIVIGPAQSPTADDLVDANAFAEVDAVYFCHGDSAMLRAARRARVLVATARVLPVIIDAGIRLDALVHSTSDPRERYRPGDLHTEPDLVAATEGTRGGAFTTASGRTGRWRAAPEPTDVYDTYGAGDCFAAALTFALARRQGPVDALGFAAERGAAALGRRGIRG